MRACLDLMQQYCQDCTPHLQVLMACALWSTSCIWLIYLSWSCRQEGRRADRAPQHPCGRLLPRWPISGGRTAILQRRVTPFLNPCCLTVIHMSAYLTFELEIQKCSGHNNGFVEQSVVRLVSNEEVRGSKPRRSTFRFCACYQPHLHSHRRRAGGRVLQSEVEGDLGREARH